MESHKSLLTNVQSLGFLAKETLARTEPGDFTLAKLRMGFR
jgi:hypothetical protein